MSANDFVKSRAALRLLAVVAVAIWAGQVAELAAQEPADKAPSREELVRAIAKIETGMSAETVRTLLGKSEFLVLDRESSSLVYGDAKEIWYVGRGEPDADKSWKPWLAHIYFDNDGKVIGAFGRGSKPLADKTIAAADLAAMLKMLEELPTYCCDYNPRPVIRAVNALQPLGKERALAVIQEFFRVSNADRDDRGGIFLLLRVLFDVPADPGYAPVMQVGLFSPGPPDDPKITPRFPIAIQDGIPFLLTGSVTLQGLSEEPEAHLVYYRKHGVIRQDLLKPTSQPLEAINQLIASPQWNFQNPGDPFFADGVRGRAIILGQIIRLLGRAYRFERKDPRDIYDKAQQERELAALAALKCRWDEAKGEYVATP
jgi:hypothetical protein